MLDGFSFANLGAEQKLTSAEMAFNADRIARQGSKRTIQDVGAASKDASSIKKEDLTEKESGGYSLSDDSSNNSNSENDDENTEDITNFKNRFVVKLNNETNMFELIEIHSEKIIETIDPDELHKMVTNMRSPSGILVNKKI